MIRVASVAVLLVAATVRLAAHPAPFSYLDIRLNETSLEGSLVLHAVDLAHELGVEAEMVVDPAQLPALSGRIAALMKQRLVIRRDGSTVDWQPQQVDALRDRDAVRLAWTVPADRVPGHVRVDAYLFPYDPNHQTFLNVYEDGELARQDVLDRSRRIADFYTGTPQGRFAVWRAFTLSGIHHIVIGPDHVLFVVGLLLLGGSLSRLLLIVSAFTVGHSITLSLATLGIVQPPAHIVEPAIALSIVYVGADNLLVGEHGRDTRAWVALFFGLVHGFGFASVLREIGLPSKSMALSLFSFNLGVEIGQAVIVLIVASALAALKRRSPAAFRRMTLAGSIVVIAAGVYWFVERVF